MAKGFSSSTKKKKEFYDREKEGRKERRKEVGQDEGLGPIIMGNYLLTSAKRQFYLIRARTTFPLQIQIRTYVTLPPARSVPPGLNAFGLNKRGSCTSLLYHWPQPPILLIPCTYVPRYV